MIATFIYIHGLQRASATKIDMGTTHYVMVWKRSFERWRVWVATVDGFCHLCKYQLYMYSLSMFILEMASILCFKSAKQKSEQIIHHI